MKELRLRAISNIDAANEYVTEFMDDYNDRFAVQPRSSHNTHRSLQSEEALDQVFTLQEQRILSKNLTLQYKNVVYQIQTSRPTYAMRKATVIVCENAQGEISILYKRQSLTYTVYRKQQRQAEVISSKSIDDKLKNIHRSSKNHPWRQYGQPFQEVVQYETPASSD